jgi:hypothetical protein
MTLRAGLIGMGSMGRNHARVLDEMPDVHFVGAVDPAVRGALNTIEQLLALEPDMAVIAAPTSKHLPVAFSSPTQGSTSSSKSPSPAASTTPGKSSTPWTAQAFTRRSGTSNGSTPPSASSTSAYRASAGCT